MEEVEYLGHIMGREGLRVHPKNIQAMQDFFSSVDLNEFWFLAFTFREVFVIIVVPESLFPPFNHFFRRHLLNLKCLGRAHSWVWMCLRDEIWMIGLGI